MSNSTTGISAGGNLQAGILNNNVTNNLTSGPMAKDPVSSFRLVKIPIHEFQGRKELLRDIQSSLTERSALNVGWQFRTVALLGFGGMGKSELARKFVQVYKSDYPNVAWIDAGTEASTKRSFEKLGTLLQCQKVEKGSDMAESIFRHVSEHVTLKSLFIYDNANRLKTNENEFGIFDYLPHGSYANPPLLLITSRTKEWGMEAIKVIEVNELSVEASVTYFVSRFRLTPQQLQNNGCQLDKLIRRITSILQGYPLALQVCASSVQYIPDDDSEIELCFQLKRFIEIISGELHSAIMEKKPLTATHYDHNFVQVWTQTMNWLKNQDTGMDSLSLLQILAYCHPDESACCEVAETFELTCSGRTTGESRRYHDASRLLRYIVLIHRRKETLSLKTHRMIQKFARRDDQCGSGLQKIFRAKKLTLLEHYISSPAELKLPILLESIQSLLQYIPLQVPVLIRKALNQSASSNLVLQCENFQNSIKEYLERKHLETQGNESQWRPRRSGCVRLKQDNSLDLYMDYVMCCDLTLKGNKMDGNSGSFVLQLERWLPESMWKHHLRSPSQVDIFCHQKSMASMDWDTEMDADIIKCVVDGIQNSDGQTQELTTFMTSLQSYNSYLSGEKANFETDRAETVDFSRVLAGALCFARGFEPWNLFCFLALLTALIFAGIMYVPATRLHF